MKMATGCVILCCFVAIIGVGSVKIELVTADGRSHETHLIENLLKGYQRMARPVANADTPVNVTIGVTLMKVGVKLENDQIEMETWVNLKWTDEGLKWNPEEYGGSLTSIRLDPNQIWTPDVVPYNMDAQFLDNWMKKTRVVVDNNGEIMYVTPATILVTCKRDIIYSPTDLSCNVKLGSWVYSGLELNLTIQSSEVDLSSYVTNSMWGLKSAQMKRNSVVYACCPEPYLDVTMRLKLSARGAIKQISRMPSIVANVLMLAAFLLPVTSANRLGLATFSLALSLTAALLHYGAGQAGSSETFYLVMWMHQANCYWLLVIYLVHVIVMVLASVEEHKGQVPTCFHSLIFSKALSFICCLSRSDPKPDDDEHKNTEKQSRFWNRVAEILNKTFGIVFFALLIISILQSSLF